MNRNLQIKLSVLLIIIFIFTLPACYKGKIKILEIYTTVQNCQPPYIVNFESDLDVGRGDIEYTWDFGDGTQSSEAKPVHVYNTPKVYTVQLTVKNKEKVDIKSVVLDINASSLPILPDFDYSSVSGSYYAPCEVNFDNYSQHATSYFWLFGDTYGSHDVNPTHTYNSAGNYTVKLAAICSEDTVFQSQQITILPPPRNININNISVALPNSYLGIDLYCKVYYDIHNEMNSNILENIGQFPVTWGFSKDLFFFDESYNYKKIRIEFWDANDIYNPEWIVETTTLKLQQDNYPTQVTWTDSNNSGFKCDLYLSYSN